MTTRTDDCDDRKPILTDVTPAASDAPTLAPDSAEPKADVAAAASAAVAEALTTAEIGIHEPFVPEQSPVDAIVAEDSLPGDAPAAITADSIVPALAGSALPGPAVPATGTVPTLPRAVPVAPPAAHPASRTMPPLTPPFLREHERRPTGGRPAPAGAPGRKAAAPTPSAPKPASRPSSRFPLLAATLALAAGLGGAVGAIGVSAFVKSAHGTDTVVASPVGQTAELESLRAMVAQHAADLGALKASLDQSAKATTAHYGKITERLDRSERAQAEPNAKLAKIFEALERLEKRPVPAAAAATGDITGTVPTTAPHAETKPKPTILEDYVLRRVFDGVALVEGRRGIIEVEPGATLPGAGRIEEIRRQDGRWVVVTQKGLIVPPR